MRPLRLDLAGFAVFRDETTIDFTGADFFALVGPTGSGKSTVLDAICFALYGTVPRWVDRRSVANALAPSANEARVRLIFESAGRRYAATRVVRRVGRAGTRVETTHAGLERLPADFDVTAPGDTLGEVLAGTPGELDQAVVEAVGLPYEQFVTCVVLPQGQFAQFLHAKGAQRQQILVNLLGLHVYERVRERATALQRDAEQRVSAIDGLLGDLDGIDDATLAAATERRDAARRLAEQVDGVLPELRSATEAVGEARQALQRLDAEVSQLSAVRPPAGATRLAAALESAQRRAADAATAVTEAEDAEAAVRDELAALPDPATLRRALDAHSERERLTAEESGFADAITAAEAEHAAAQQAVTDTAAAVARAESELTRAQTEDLASGVRAHLVAGEPCPVCLQHVDALPEVAPAHPVADAKTTLSTARQHHAKADAAARDLAGSLAHARAHHERVTARLGELDGVLAGHDEPGALTEQLTAVEALTARLTDTASAVRRARQAYRAASSAENQAIAAVRDAWRDFDRVRDGLATLQPPAIERDDLAAAWRTLAGWAEAEAAARTARRGSPRRTSRWAPRSSPSAVPARPAAAAGRSSRTPSPRASSA
ncbi:MAG: AAA family ATPase, partial [Micromonosporaceae bacterium]